MCNRAEPPRIPSAYMTWVGRAALVENAFDRSPVLFKLWDRGFIV